VTPVTRCAVYARFSSEKQSPLSIEDQVRKCREYAKQYGWSVLDPHMYCDEAVSGATDDRRGLRRMLAAATSKERPFDVVLCDDTSRISRTLKDSFTIHDELRFAGVRLTFVSQGIDTDSEQAEVLLATHGIVDTLYIRELAKKTRRGVEGRALNGFHTGGRCFGYRNVPIEDASRIDQHGRATVTGVRLEVSQAEANKHRAANFRDVRRREQPSKNCQATEHCRYRVAPTPEGKSLSFVVPLVHPHASQKRTLSRARHLGQDNQGALQVGQAHL
jgi:DNA invertase Pin-like site-specific DNA recombinase